MADAAAREGTGSGLASSEEAEPRDDAALALVRARTRALVHDRLRELPPSIVEDPVALESFRSHTDAIVAMVLEEALGTGPARAEMAADVGRERARQRVHPADSLEAAQVLNECVLRAAMEHVGSLPVADPAEACLRVASATTSVFLRVVAAAADGHLEALMSEIADSHAAERRRIARELHDRTGNALAAAQRHLEIVGHLRDSPPGAGEDPIDRAWGAAVHAVRDSMAGVRATIEGLRNPTDVDTFEEFLAQVGAQHPSAAEVHVSVRGEEGRVPAAVREEVFLMLRESVRNAVRHAHADRIEVDVDIGPATLGVTTRDDGVGVAADQQPGAGMASMRERADILGGQVDVVPGPGGSGTVVVITVPLPGALEDGPS